MECIKKRLKTDAGHIRLKGSAVVEMSYIIPLFLGLFVLIVHAVFYYHDKAVLNAAAAETAVLGAQTVRRKRQCSGPRPSGGKGRSTTWKDSSESGQTGN